MGAEACSPPAWFEAATCRIELNVTGGFPRGDLPSKPEVDQKTGCSVVFASMDLTHPTSPLNASTDTSLMAWKCDMPTVPQGTAGSCLAFPPGIRPRR
jgi:hypothetical protein